LLLEPLLSRSVLQTREIKIRQPLSENTHGWMTNENPGFSFRPSIAQIGASFDWPLKSGRRYSKSGKSNDEQKQRLFKARVKDVSNPIKTLG
jgi:hypothetical protein